MFKIWDIENKKWFNTNNIYIDSRDMLFEIKEVEKKTLLRTVKELVKTPLKLEDNKYRIYNDTKRKDVNGVEIWQGDIFVANNEMGIVYYNEDLQAFEVLHLASSERFVLTKELTDMCTVLGHIETDINIVEKEQSRLEKLEHEREDKND